MYEAPWRQKPGVGIAHVGGTLPHTATEGNGGLKSLVLRGKSLPIFSVEEVALEVSSLVCNSEGTRGSAPAMKEPIERLTFCLTSQHAGTYSIREGSDRTHMS